MKRRDFLSLAAAAAVSHARTARKFVSTPFGNIAYLERGSARETALFLHGFPLSADQWTGAMARLAGVRRCLAPDFMAMGHTEVNAGQSLAPEAQTAMLVAFLDRLSIGAVDVIANDSGGAVAQLLVARHSSRVRTMLLTNCDSEGECPPVALKPVIELARAGTFAGQWLAPWLADKRLARSASGIGGMCYTDPAHPTDAAIAAYFGPILASSKRRALIHEFAVALERNSLAGIGPALQACQVPARIVWGMADTIFSPASAGTLSRSFGNSRGVRELPGRKLFWPEELPQVIASEARALWRNG